MWYWPYSSSRIYFFVFAIILILYGILFLIFNVLVATNDLMSYPGYDLFKNYVYGFGISIGLVLILNGAIIGVFLFITKRKTKWMIALMFIYQLILWISTVTMIVYIMILYSQYNNIFINWLYFPSTFILNI